MDASIVETGITFGWRLEVQQERMSASYRDNHHRWDSCLLHVSPARMLIATYSEATKASGRLLTLESVGIVRVVLLDSSRCCTRSVQHRSRRLGVSLCNREVSSNEPDVLGAARA